MQDRDSSGAVLDRYDFAHGQPVALWSASDGKQLLHADALGSIVATTAVNGSLKSDTLYDAWGNPTTREGSSANKFAFTAHQADAETGLYYFKARYYDPETGRFLSEDPADGEDGKPASYHRYLYAYGNPLVYVDPDGGPRGQTVTVTGETRTVKNPMPSQAKARQRKSSIRSRIKINEFDARLCSESAQIRRIGSSASRGQCAPPRICPPTISVANC